MNRKLMVVLAVALLLVPAVPFISASATLTVQIGPKYYNAGDAVAITGTAAANATVQIDVTYNSASVFSANAVANSAGAYTATYTIPAGSSTGVYTITATSGTESDDTVFMVTSVSTSEMATQLIESAEKSQTLAEETIQGIIALNYTMPAAVNSSMTQGANAIADAKAFYAQGLYVAAAEAAQRAMNHFKNAMTLAIRAGRPEDFHHDDENETLTHQIEMLGDEVERISEVLDNISDSQNVTAIQMLVQSAEASLTLASTYVEAGNYTEAATAAKSARDDLRDAMQQLQALLKDVRKGLMERFKERLRERINATETELDELGGNIMNATNARHRFGLARGFINRAEQQIANGTDDDALNDLEEATNEYAHGLCDIDNNGYSQGMKQTNTIRAQIQVLEELLAKMKEQGQDTSAVEAKIAELQALLDEGMGMMQNGKVDDANDLFEGHRGGSEHGMGGGMDHGQGKGRN